MLLEEFWIKFEGFASFGLWEASESARLGFAWCLWRVRAVGDRGAAPQSYNHWGECVGIPEGLCCRQSIDPQPGASSACHCPDMASNTSLKMSCQNHSAQGLSLWVRPMLEWNSPPLVPPGHRPALLGNRWSLGTHNTSHSSVYSNGGWK